MVEKRKHKRIDIIYYLSVFDRNTDDLIGYIQDITSEGLRLITEKQLKKDAMYQLTIELSSILHENKKIDIDATCIRCVPGDSESFYECGFKFEKIKPEYIDEITLMIQTFRLDD